MDWFYRPSRINRRVREMKNAVFSCVKKKKRWYAGIGKEGGGKGVVIGEERAKKEGSTCDNPGNGGGASLGLALS